MPRKQKPPPPELIAARPCTDLLAPHPATLAHSPSAPYKYTKAVHEAIVHKVSQGNRPQVAAALAGITWTTLQAWFELGRTGQNPALAQLAEDIEQAMAVAESKALATIIPPDDTNPENAKWFLEHARPDAWSKQTRHVVLHELTEFLDRLEKSLPPEIFEKVLAVATGSRH